MFAITLLLISELCRTSGWIDIPSPAQYDITGMLGGAMTFSLPLFNEDPNPNDDQDVDPLDFNMVFRYGLAGKGEISLSMYMPTVYALSGTYIVKKGSAKSPTLYCGVEDISYNPYLSSIGMGDDRGFLEEYNYAAHAAGRPWELMSMYFAMHQKVGAVANLILGLGRGRFVGYGRRSHIFNTDLFVLGSDYSDPDARISWWAFGLFLGGSLKFGPTEFIMEMDGRDGNIGMKYYHRYFTGVLALTKCEHFFGNARPFSPRLTFGVEGTNRFLLEGPAGGSIECQIKDNNTKEMIPDAVVDIKEINKRYKAAGGTFTMSLPVGNYTITIIKPNYEDYMAKISVKAGTKSKLIFNLKKTADALKLEAAAQEKEKNIKTYFEQGRVYFSEGNLGDARTAFQMVLALDPNHQEAQNYLAQIDTRKLELIAVYSAEAKARTQAKDWTKALEFWNKVLQLDSNHAEARTAVANLQKQIAEAKAPPKQPVTPPKPAEPKATAAEIEALYNKGVSRFVAEQYDEALKIFKQVLALDPNHAGAKDYKSRTEARLKVLKGGG